MARIREQNEKIKQRRADVKADEDAFKKTQEAERVKLAKTRKVQEQIDRTREQNAQRKMDKALSREWDSGKKMPPSRTATDEGDLTASFALGRGRGGGRGRGRGEGGRGRGRGSAAGALQKDAASAGETPSAPATPAAETLAAPAAESVAAS
ncbi:hypothetical protein NEOLEDRAFT_1165096 [Neolentinus lepideus HHB14362 ss-1]|uniref:Uncharacterized protein n=1 Tax=Neolentinus lepideus HHB14362 ss-1 TaxID=1314782 RepID=A0A165NXJ3_9AGAM|nr:hypothetical protein NEOLEDRAFT_1165096 [Neolentinus lepideus HHB14362 ss-1]